MKLRPLYLTLALLSAGVAHAADDEATTLVKLAQERLHIHGFYDGRIDGDPSGYTQAAIAKFQLSQSLPADGSLDRRTLEALGVQQEESASTGSSSAPELVGATPENPNSGS